MRLRFLTFAAVVVGIGACNSEESTSQTPPASQAPGTDPVSSAGSDGGTNGGDTEVVGPLGLEFEVFASSGRVQVRAGETREIQVTARSVGESGGVWSLSTDDVLREGVGIATGPPATLDFDAASEAVFTIAVAVPADAEPGTAGSLDVIYDPPAESVTPAWTTSRFAIEVVAADTPVGPIAISDFVGVPTDGASFDPTANDIAGDAAIDPSTLSVVEAPSSGGTLTVTGPGEFAYVPAGSSGESAEYEICDLNGTCTTATLNLWLVT